MLAVWPMTRSPSTRNGGAKAPRGPPQLGQVVHQGVLAAARVRILAGDIDIVRAGRFQRQADEFTAPLDARPIMQLIGHAL
jgi:hypothetical protein